MTHTRARNLAEYDPEAEKLLFCPDGSGLHVEFYGLPFDDSEAFVDVLALLASPHVAPHVRSLVFRGPDEGDNGTRNWDFTPLIESEPQFSDLRSLFIEPTAPEHHNHTIIGADYDEEGQIGQLLNLCPRLQNLTVPSAPDASFFEREANPLWYLRVESGYDTQDFVLNLSQSACFPFLRDLDFGDYNERYLEDYPTDCTPFEHYEELFRSAAFSSVRNFTLRNSNLSLEQLKQLRDMWKRKEGLFMVIQAPPGEYIG